MKFLKILLNFIISYFKGDLILKLKLDKYFVELIIAFIFVCLYIFIGLSTDKALVDLEKSEKQMKIIKSEYIEKKIKEQNFYNIRQVEKLLKDSNIDVCRPTKPAENIVR